MKEIFPQACEFSDCSLQEQAVMASDVAEESAKILLERKPLNMHSTEMHMRAIGGLLNGPVTNEVYDRMSQQGRNAIQEVGDECARYFAKNGMLKNMSSEMIAANPDYRGRNWQLPDYLKNKFLINRMQQAVQDAAMNEEKRVQSVLYSGVKPSMYADMKIDFPDEDPSDAEMMRLSSDRPYNEGDIRGALFVFGSNARTIFTAMAEVISSDQRFSPLHHAYGCLKATIPYVHSSDEEVAPIEFI